MQTHWNSPIHPHRVRAVLDIAQLTEHDRVLDIGCGAGGLLTLVPGHGIDLRADLIEQARKVTPDSTFEVADVRQGLPSGFRMAACLGSSHAFDDGRQALVTALTSTHQAVVSDGWLLLGELIRRSELPEDYRKVLGGGDALSRTHLDVVQLIEASGWCCEYATTATQAEWDDFEWTHYRRHRNTAWRDGYLRWGRQHMGFGLYLARRA